MQELATSSLAQMTEKINLLHTKAQQSAETAVPAVSKNVTSSCFFIST